MPERDGYIPGVPCWVDTSQPDPEAAVDFYQGLFGGSSRTCCRRIRRASTSSPGSRAATSPRWGSIPETAPQMATWNTYVWADSADETASKVTRCGGSVLMEPFDVMESGRMAVFADPEGPVLRLAGRRSTREPGRQRARSVNFNDLHTRDQTAPKAFYGAVFGWEALELPGGVGMWRLPGYGDHLMKDNPGLGEMMDERAAPRRGFKDVVASINPIGDDQPDTPAHWGVTFAVDEADAIAEKPPPRRRRRAAPGGGLAPRDHRP